MKILEFKNLDIKINSGEFVAIIGPNGCGKTTLLNNLCGKIKNTQIFIDNKCLNELTIDYKINNIVCVFDDTFFNKKNVKEELVFYLNKLNLNQKEINKRLALLINFFNISDLVEYDFDVLTTQERIFIKILSLLIINPSIFAIDDLFTYLDKDKVMMILNYIKEKNITFISVISDMEELILFDKILVMNKGKKYKYDKRSIILKDDEMFKKLGLSLPFINDINNLLKDYELINNDYFIMKELVDILWK